MSCNLGVLGNERVLALLRLNKRVENPANCPLKSNKPKRSISAYFAHSHEPVNILRAPTRGTLIDVSHKGYRINHYIGNAFANYKHVDAAYCKDLFHSKYNPDPAVHFFENPIDVGIVSLFGKKLWMQEDTWSCFN